MRRTPVLVVPGWTNSGPEHWQSIWQREHPDWQRVQQDDWDRPQRAAWVSTLESAVSQVSAPPVLVAHSLGALLVAIWAAERPTPNVAGALLVAPPDLERADTVPELASFRPTPMDRLPFPSILVASRSDPYLGLGARG
jgi:predicted alpha/beta hydrolase family esterase